MNINYLCLTVILLFTLIIVFKCCVKIKYKFWSYQPVFHYHNLLYWIYPKGVINTALPEPNKYCNFINIITREFAEYNDTTLDKILAFIAANYYTQQSVTYAPSREYLTSYFSGVNNKAHISLYYKPIALLTDTGFAMEQEIAAIMTTRSVNITLHGCETFPAYYVECLCVHNSYRRQDLAPQLIQTHIYNVYHRNKTIKYQVRVSLFKREGVITGIVPLTAYNTYQFDISAIPKNSVSLHASTPIIEINKLNIRLLTSFIHTQSKRFKCFVLPDLVNLLRLINSKIYMVYGIIENQELIAAYFFRDSQLRDKKISPVSPLNNVLEGEQNVSNTMTTIDFFGSINNTCDDNMFLIGFNTALRKAIKRDPKVSKKSVKLITIENISDNNLVINNLFALNIVPKFTNPTAYFYYNYAKRPIIPELAFIL